MRWQSKLYFCNPISASFEMLTKMTSCSSTICDRERTHPIAPTLRNIFASLLLSLAVHTGTANSQAIPIPPTHTGFFSSSEPTMTFLFEAAEAKATLVFVPGGEGRRGIKPDWTASHGYFSKYHFTVMLRSLSDPKLSSGKFNVVIFDSPTNLDTKNHWSGQRTSADHLSRVEDVVRHYKTKLGKPVWIMGHSMGSISITEFYKRLQDNKNEGMVAGLIWSGGINGTTFNFETTKLPVLVIHHENDECVGTTPAYAKTIYTKLREKGNTSAELVFINTGTRTSGDVCRSGYHMYHDAGPDVTKVLDQFMNQHLAP